ncbi:hypothetical protein BH23PAT2_BH23PAT2_05330 [soil metagenome]
MIETTPRTSEDSPQFDDFSAIVASNGSRRIYGMNGSGARQQLTHDEVLASFGYKPANVYDYDEPVSGNVGEDNADVAKPTLPEDVATSPEKRTPETNPYREMLLNGGRLALDKSQKEEVKAEAKAWAEDQIERSEVGVRRQEAISAKRKARENYLDWKKDVDVIRAERQNQEKTAWQVKMGIKPESALDGMPETPDKRSQRLAQERTEYVSQLKAIDRAMFASQKESSAIPGQDRGDDATTPETTPETTPGTAIELYRKNDAAAMPAQPVDTSKDSTELIDQEEADSRPEDDKAREDRYFVPKSAENNEDDNKGRLRRFTGSLRSIAFKAGMIGAGTYAYLRQSPARSNQWINEKMPESWSPRTKNIVKGVGGAVVLGALVWAAKEYGNSEVPAGIDEQAGAIGSDGEVSSVAPEAGTDVSIDTTEGLPEDIDAQAGAVGEDGEVTSAAPEAEGTDATGEQAGSDTDDAPSGESEERSDVDGIPEAEINTESMQVGDEEGFLKSFKSNYNLSDSQAHEVYERMKSLLAGSEGTYTVGTDIRISSSGSFALPEEAQKVLDEYLRSIGRL